MKIFWSYSRRDDSAPAKKVSKLKERFRIVLSQVAGADCEVYFDLISLPWGVEWRKEIDRLIDECDALVAVVTPSYFNSRACIHELQRATNCGRKILPIYYRTCKELRSKFKEDGQEAEINQKLNLASLAIGQAQMKDFRELRNEKIASKNVENFLDELAEDIA